MAMTDAQKRAQRNYVKESVRQIALRFYPAEADLWEWLQAQDNKQGYLKGLVRADMAKTWNAMERHEQPWHAPRGLITSQIDTAPKPDGLTCSSTPSLITSQIDTAPKQRTRPASAAGV